MNTTIEYGTGRYSTRKGRAAVRSLIAMQWDGHDLKGSTLGPLFGVCDTLYALGEHVPDECGYSPSPLLDSTTDLADDWPASEFVWMETNDKITAEDLQYWARVLDRYMDMFVRGTDHDY